MTLSGNQEAFNKSIADLNNNISGLRDNEDLTQQIIRRVDVLEARPDQQKQMLAEYARNWDTLSKIVNGTYKNQQDVSSQLNQKMNYVVQAVNDKQVVIDRQTLNDIEALVRTETGFNLRNYIKEVQQEAIDKNFDALNEHVNNKIDALADDINEYTEQKRNNLKRDNELAKHIKSIYFIVIFLFLLQMFTNFTQYVYAFHHYFWTSVIGLIVIVAVSGLAVWAVGKWKDKW